MHVKIVVGEKLADIYMMDMETPALTVELKLEHKTGAVELWGLNFGTGAKFANFALKPMKNPKIKGTPFPQKPAIPGSILSWDVSNTFDGKSLDGKNQLTKKDKAGLTYTKLKSDPNGLTNLSRVQGVSKGKNSAFAKVIISSNSNQIKKMDVGFANQIKVYLNNNALFTANDNFRTRDYRFLGTIGYYDSVYLPLKKGNNEILLMITEGLTIKGGWGVQAKFENMDGIEIK